MPPETHPWGLLCGKAVAVSLALVAGVASSFAAEKEHRYFRFVPTKLRDTPGAPNSVQISEFELRLHGQPINLAGATITNPGGSSPAGEGAANLIDGSVQTKWLDFNKGGAVIGFPAPVRVDAYRFATANDAPERDPANWRLEGSDDGLRWTILDEAVNRGVPSERRAFTPVFDLPATVPPYAAFWHPGALLRWSAADDPNADFHRASVPLAERHMKPSLQVNPNARPNEGKVAVLSTFGVTSYNPAQGSAAEHFNAYTGWQYTDKLVFWGGSAGEGLILAPTAPVIDAAHRNGVPVLGTVFFPPGAYGGQFHWVREFLQKDGSAFPVADKLIEVARHHGFDGWFINQETAGGNSSDATAMRDFIIYFRQQAPELEVMWYDAMTEGGSISWQNALTTSNDMFLKDGTSDVAHSMFLNFWWNSTGLTNSRNRALSLGIDPYSVYAGIDVESAGSGTDANWDAIFPPGQPHKLSVAFYGAQSIFRNSGNPGAFQDSEVRFWSGANGDPANTTTASSWKGLAHYVPATTPIDTVPFVTNFNRGQGNRWNVDGQPVATGGWNNLSLQDVLPTWRWVVRSTGSKLKPSLNLGDAYYGGTSLHISGTLDAPNEMKLFAASLPVTANTRFRIHHKTGSAGAPTRMQVALAFEDAPAAFHYIDVGPSATSGWNLRDVSLGAYAGRKIAVIGLRFASPTAIPNYQIRIGRIAVTEGTPAAPAAPLAPEVVQRDELDGDAVSLRMNWQAPAGAEIYHYNIYHRLPDNSRRWLGATPARVFHIPALRRQGTETQARLEIEAVARDFGASPAAALFVAFPDATDRSHRLSGAIIGTTGSWSNAGNTREKVFDRNLTTAFDAPETEGGWVGLDFGPGRERRITAIRYAPRPNFAGRMVGGVFQGANQADFSDARTLFVVPVTPPELQFTNAAVTHPGMFRYFRYAAGGHCNIAEIEVYGYGPPGTPGGLAATRSASSVNLTWSAATWAGTYEVQRAGSADGLFATLSDGIASGAFQDDNPPATGSSFYRVRTVNPVDAGAWTEAIEVPPQAGYAAWRAAAFGDAPDTVAGELADPDGDGLANLLEFALGTDPLAADPAPLALAGTDDPMALTFSRRAAADGVTLEVAWSDDLVVWSTAGVTLEVVESEGDRETARAEVPRGPGPRRFVRLQGSAP